MIQNLLWKLRIIKQVQGSLSLAIYSDGGIKLNINILITQSMQSHTNFCQIVVVIIRIVIVIRIYGR